ncbi:hypothetical protein FVR03_21845 [Pontibacter qinzhouensis]|uniref:Uncharacterized protein n=1 Tax=Pontibacter qinzhouensis TaxID=2603253 RepID=A0A5C8IYU2_9BACT|nr:hypothetical protein [Pontibacter qinzhouensis]TXK26407.1 hypothetical protein FVR03_21845 [Pontibacter qinzhouensis]
MNTTASKTYNFKRRSFSSGPQLLGLIFIGAGLMSLLSPFVLNDPDSFMKSMVVGGVAVAIGVLGVSAYSGTLLDVDGRKVKNYSAILGYKFGRWEPLPPISKIAVLPAHYKSSHTPNGISPTWSVTVTAYKVVLCAANTAASPSFAFTKKEHAIAEATTMAASLKVPCDVRIAEKVNTI